MSHKIRPLVTVCLPVYNNDRHLVFAIKSILEQTYERIEVVAIDDCSTDNSYNILLNYQSEFFRVFKNEYNLGMAPNWNKCVELSRGDYIKMMGGDDVLHPNCIERQVAAFVDSVEPLSIVSSSKGIIRETGETLFDINNPYLGYVSSKNAIRSLVRSGRNTIGEPVVCLLSKQALINAGYFNAPNNYVLDIATWIKMLNFGGLYGLRQKHADFRISITSNGANEGVKQLSQYFNFVCNSKIGGVSLIDKLLSIFNSFFAGLARNAVFAYVKLTTK